MGVEIGVEFAQYKVIDDTVCPMRYDHAMT